MKSSSVCGADVPTNLGKPEALLQAFPESPEHMFSKQWFNNECTTNSSHKRRYLQGCSYGPSDGPLIWTPIHNKDLPYTK